MDQGMRNVITEIVRESTRCQQDAARFWKYAKRFYCEIEELKFRMGGTVEVSQDTKTLCAHISPTIKKKMIHGQSVSSEAKAVQIHKPLHLPLSIRSCGDRYSTVPANTVFPVQASVTTDNENDIPITSMKYSLGEFANKYGHMATSKVTKSHDDILLPLVIRLLKINSAMETRPIDRDY